MVGRIITLIAIMGIVSLVSTIHGHVYANLIIGKNEINNNQIQPVSPIAILINNQSTNKELMSELKSQIQHSDPFKVRGIDNDRNSTNLTSREGIYPNDVNSNDVNSNDVNSNDVNSNDVNSNDVNSNDLKHNDDNDCNSNCPEKSKPTKYDIPFELPSIPFP
ncbi:MAG: hypothetical protein E6L04_06670 [Thaumarchaeota archaeon]|nr:MAG: hypothetical protein E6L04_06670 [Nitrososphaerota archaeon]